MLGKTHMMVGIASVLAITQPDSPVKILTAIVSGGIGALICDIDVGTSRSHKEADKITLLAVFILAASFAADYFLHIGLFSRIVGNSGLLRVIAGLTVFILLCAWGKEQPHRSFMHSLLALAALSFALLLIYPPVVPYFAVGFISHIATDLFNFKKVRILYPMKGGAALNMFHAHGIANTVFLIIGSVVTAAELLYLMILK